MKTFLLSLLIALPKILLAQVFTGTISDSTTGIPLAYANIGVKGKGIGGIADSQGRFRIDLSHTASVDSIVISYLGYLSKSFVKQEISASDYQVKLMPAALQLREVVAVGKREVISIGNKKASNQYTGWGDYASSRGRLRGVAIETIEIPLKLMRFKMRLSACEFDSVRFRLHILPLKENYTGDLASELVNQNIFFNAVRGQRWVDIDLQPYNLVINQNIVVAVEWVDAWVKNEVRDESYKLTIAMSRKEGYIYIRETPEESFKATKSKFTPTMYFDTHKTGSSLPVN